MSEYDLQKLITKKEKLREKLAKLQANEAERFGKMGWGTAMRGYQKLKQLSFSKSDSVKLKIDELDEQIKKFISERVTLSRLRDKNKFYLNIDGTLLVFEDCNNLICYLQHIGLSGSQIDLIRENSDFVDVVYVE